ncbi:hypothetical protein DRO19_02715 [Candidatus Bathyarchaeota archaeon]|nr:MAG: hypothetical protein DRO19_02715 [Candidatus Bathyarchaeota archaeon]
MERKVKVLLALAWAVSLVLAFGAGFAVQNLMMLNRRPSRTVVGANVFVTVETPMGVQAIPIHNVITNIGEQQAAERFRTDGSYTALKYISIGNATASASLTQLSSEYTRVEGTVSSLWQYNGEDYAFNCTKKFTFTETVTLNAAGLHWATSGDNNMYAVANFDQTTFQNNWNLTITWVVVFDGN